MVHPEVEKLTKDTLSASEFEEAQDVAAMLALNRLKAIHKLRSLVRPPPRRPLWYVQHELLHLPSWTRDSIRYLGDYIDLLVKAMAFELTGDRNSLRHSLGINLWILGRNKYSIPSDLVDKLKRYNSFLYQPGKHDFDVPFDIDHRFSPKEVVFTVFITRKLADEIKHVSPLATQLSLDKAELSEVTSTIRML